MRQIAVAWAATNSVGHESNRVSILVFFCNSLGYRKRRLLESFPFLVKGLIANISV
jgi:hypothetical protein